MSETMLSPAPDPTSQLDRTPVRRAMEIGLFECPPDGDLRMLARTLAQQRIHCVFVPNLDGSGGRLSWGLVTDVDIVRALGAGRMDARARDLAHRSFVSVRPGDSLRYAAVLMVRERVTHLVVLSPDTDRPVGMLSSLDIARAAAANPQSAPKPVG